MHRASNTVEPSIEDSNYLPRLRRLGEGGEVAQIGREQYGTDRLTGAAAQRSRLHPSSAAPAEIGFEQRCESGSRGEDSDGRRGEARGFVEPGTLRAAKRSASGPPQH